MKCLLVFCYFCPSANERPGGVQQVVGPLLDGLDQTGGWHITVAHHGLCEVDPAHQEIADPGDTVHLDHIDSVSLVSWASVLHNLAGRADVVLSIDRLVPHFSAVPSVLMANTAEYLNETSAVLGGAWSSIVAPTQSFADQVRVVNPSVDVAVIPYGLSHEVIEQVAGLPPPDWKSRPLVARLPHRPDWRKGHVAAIEGLARKSASERPTNLEISWLDEPQSGPFLQRLKDTAATRGVADQVKFRPWLDGAERWPPLAESHALLQVGVFRETFGLAAVEAALSGRLVISSGQPAVREVLADNPLHVEVADPLDWRQALENGADRLSVDPNSSARAQLRAELDLDHMVCSYDDLLSRLIGERS